MFSDKHDVILELENGDRVVLVNMLDAPEAASFDAVSRNVFRVNLGGVRVWQVGEYAPMPTSTFTNIYWGEAGELLASNFDGGEYQIDLRTGKVKPLRLSK